MKKGFIWGLVVFFALALGPVLTTQLRPENERFLSGTHLADLTYHEVTFSNTVQGLELGGMLFVPEGEGPFPAVVIIHGSGTSQRDNIWYLTLVNHLQENGVAVLLPDKRGSVESEGSWRTSSYEDLATDTVAGLEFMQSQDIVRISELGVIGMSQGGVIAPIVVTQYPALDFVVDMVGGTTDAYEQLYFEEVLNLQQMGFLPGVSHLIAYPSTYVLRNFTQKDFWGAIGNFDPLPYWEQVEIPALVLLGQEDTNVPTAASVARLEELDNPHIEVRVFEGSGHALQDPEGQGDRIIRQEALEAIMSFILESSPERVATPIRSLSPRFVFQGAGSSIPILTRDPSPEFNNLYVNPGAVLFHDRQFHMFFNSFTSWPGTIKVGYAVSADGLTWTLAQDAPVFLTSAISYGLGHADISSVLVLDDGTWVMYFHTIREGQIGRATAAGPLGPWTPDAEPVLLPGPDGAWDSAGVSWPNVLRTADGFRMYYGVKGKGIGLATSEDGIIWTKYDDRATTDAAYGESDPVLVGEAGWEGFAADRPRVVLTPDGWVMIYQAGAIENRGLALSEDGIHWTKYDGNPIFNSQVFPIPRAKTWDTTLIYHKGVYYYILELGSVSNGTDLYLATHEGTLLAP